MDDLISRKAALDAMADTLWHCPNECYKNLNSYEFAKALAELGLKSVPSAQKKGHWICIHPLQEDDPGAYICSECKLGKWGIDPKSYFFCPNCGADMRGESDG